MADTTVASNLQQQQWEDDFYAEYTRDTLFYPYMGTDENSIIQVKEDLMTKAGKTITFQLVTRLQGSGITGDNTLEGNEEALGNYGHNVTVDQLRNAVRRGKMEQKHTNIDILEAARVMLKLWIMDDLRNDIISAMMSPNIDGVTAYASCNEAMKDAWVTANSDRVLFGAVVSNYSTGDHSASLLNVDSTTDVLDYDIIQLAKRRTKKADRHIRPIQIKGGREFFVAFCESYSFRDLKADTESMHTSGAVRGKDNPLFTDPDLMLDGVICREVPEIPVITGVGASSIDVGPNFMCGAQALGVAWAQRSKFAIDKTIDYGNIWGVSISEVRGVEKLSWGSIQHGIHTIYTSGAADS
jgi:N4-gp56 family major capsid protein